MSRILMICHDQNLDRRVVAQAASLIGNGHHVTLLALSFNAQEEKTILPEGIELIRIGLANIKPGNATYLAYIARQQCLNQQLNSCCNFMDAGRPVWNGLFRAASRGNWLIYRTLLLLRYRNRRMHDPLPFTSAFLDAGMSYPADLVQVHDLPGLEAGALLAEKWQVPLVYDAHELYPEQRSFSAAQRRICSRAEAILIPKAHRVFAVNESIAEEMTRRYRINTPQVLLNAMDPPPGFNPQEKYNLLREKLSLAPERRILLFQGGFAPHRNLETLIEAMCLVSNSDVDLVLMGFGPFGDTLKQIAARRGLLHKRVHFLPAVLHSELLQHSASADIGIIPYPHADLNSYYCTPNKLFEFIQANLPILANDSPELRRFVGLQDFGVIQPLHTARQIADAIDFVFASTEIAIWKQRLFDRCKQFSWRVQSINYLNVITQLLENNRPQEPASKEPSAHETNH